MDINYQLWELSTYFLDFQGCLRSLPLKILLSISGIEIGGGLRLYWFQKCSLSLLDFVEEGVEVPLEFIEEGVKDPLKVEEGLEIGVESYNGFKRWSSGCLKGSLEASSSVFNPLDGGFRLLFRVNDDVLNRKASKWQRMFIQKINEKWGWRINVGGQCVGE